VGIRNSLVAEFRIKRVSKKKEAGILRKPFLPNAISAISEGGRRLKSARTSILMRVLRSHRSSRVPLILLFCLGLGLSKSLRALKATVPASEDVRKIVEI
jgi:hypothetical protein